MVKNFLRKKGVPAFAYPARDASTPWLCTLKIINSDAQFAVSLEHSIRVDGEQQLITLRYEGDNLMPSSMSLEDRDIKVPAEPLFGTLRQGSPEVRILSLTLKQSCSVWYPKEYSKLDISFHRLLTLARATEVCICFDTRWLGENTAEFQEIVRGSREFVGVPLIPQFTNLYQKADWQILNFIPAAEPRACIPSEDPVSGTILSIEDVRAEAPPLEDVVHDNPPPYAHVLGKHSRPDFSPTPDAQDSKRARKYSCSSSETEHATPAPPLRAESTASSTATVPADLFQEAVTSAVENMLSHVLKTELTQVVKQELPRVVADLFRKTPAGHSPSRCLSPAPPCSRIPNALTNHDATPTHNLTLSTMIKRAVTTAVHEAFDETLHETLDEYYNSVSIDLEEFSGDLKSDWEASNEDHIVRCNDELNEMEAKFNQRLVESLDDFKACADEVVLATENRLNKLGDTISNQAFCGRGNVLVASKQSQRATSLPVSRDDKENYEGSMKWRGMKQKGAAPLVD